MAPPPASLTLLGAAADEPTLGCALVSLRASEDPAGTATPFDLLVLLEIPPPWPTVAFSDPRVPSEARAGLAELAREGVRGSALLVDDGAPPVADGRLGVTVWRGGHCDDGAPYAGVRARRRPADLVAFVRSVLQGADAGQDAQPAERTWLVCTHGERDGCCGRFGEAAFQAARELASTGTPAPDPLRVWRCSHFGGHRFAPTLLDLPEGRMWGFLDASALSALADRGGPPPPLRRHYRGWCAVPTYAQAAERDLYDAHGRAWRTARVSVRSLGAPDAAGVPAGVELQAHGLAADGPRRWRADLHVTHGASVPASCGGPDAPRRAVVPHWHDDPKRPGRAVAVPWKAR